MQTQKRINLIRGGKSTVKQVAIFIVLAVLFGLMLTSFDIDDMIYFSRYSIYNSLEIWIDVSRDILRFAIGIVGSLMVLSLLNLLIEHGLFPQALQKALSKIGRMTFGIYVFQDILLFLLSPVYRHLSDNYYIINSIVLFLVIFGCSIYLTQLSERKKWASILFLGNIATK